MRTLLLLSVAVLVPSCSSFLAPNDRAELNEARARWEAAAISNYRYRLDHHCFCGIWPYHARVEVRGGAITSVRDADTGDIPPQVHGIVTIPELFDRIERALDNDADEVHVVYDEEYGFPTNIQLDHMREAIDDESEVWVREFEVID